jgi:hypothetical protein
VNATKGHDSLRADAIELISRYFAAIDDKRLELSIVEATFASDGRMVRPNGAELVGAKAITEAQSESFTRFRATQHVITDHIVDLEADRASIRANVVATHLWGAGHGDPCALESHFTAGGVLRVELVRSQASWRIHSLSNQVVWRTGSGFSQMLATGRGREGK